MHAVRDWFTANPWAGTATGILVIVAIAFAATSIAWRVLLPLVFRAIRRSDTRWDDILLDRQLLHRLALFAPVVVVYTGVPLIPGLPGAWTDYVQLLARALLLLIATAAAISLLSACSRLYSTFPISRDCPIKGYVQVSKIVVFIFGGVYVIAILAGRSPWLLLSGLGAMTAIILLIFKDTILSLVASIQITQNDMVRVGDWIQMPEYDVDGDVVEVALHTLKVQNWDKTIATIPVHKFVQEPFRNWRGMTQAGGRRIKRSINIDMSTIRFLTDEETERFRRFLPLRDYMNRKLEELAAHAADHDPGPEMTGNPRRLTNIGTLRAYIFHYLKQLPDLNTESMMFLVRQLQPGPEGLPLEIYVFARDTTFVGYEGIQSDIFDHVLAMTPQFGLRAFQGPSGADVRAIVGNQRQQ